MDLLMLFGRILRNVEGPERLPRYQKQLCWKFQRFHANARSQLAGCENAEAVAAGNEECLRDVTVERRDGTGPCVREFA